MIVQTPWPHSDLDRMAGMLNVITSGSLVAFASVIAFAGNRADVVRVEHRERRRA